VTDERESNLKGAAGNHSGKIIPDAPEIVVIQDLPLRGLPSGTNLRGQEYSTLTFFLRAFRFSRVEKFRKTPRRFSLEQAVLKILVFG
jgi:hypothetical protein